MATRLSLRGALLAALLALAWSAVPALAQKSRAQESRVQASLAPLPIPFATTLGGDRVAEPVETAGAGEVKALLIGNELMVTGTYENLSSPLARSGAITGANIRRAPPGEEGLVNRLSAEQATLGNNGRSMTLTTDGGTAGGFHGVFTLTDEQVEELERGLFYVQLYTEAHPTGELRGQLHTDMVLDPTEDDFIGIWQTHDGRDTWQVYGDGIWTFLATLAEAGEASTSTWRLDGNIATWDRRGGICEGRYVHREVLYRDGRRRSLILEAGPCVDAGTWRDLYKIDAEGNRVPLRD